MTRRQRLFLLSGCPKLTRRALSPQLAKHPLWLGWAYLTKTMRKPQRGGVNFDPPIICCACSMQNVPTADKMFQMSSYLV